MGVKVHSFLQMVGRGWIDVLMRLCQTSFDYKAYTFDDRDISLTCLSSLDYELNFMFHISYIAARGLYCGSDYIVTPKSIEHTITNVTWHLITAEVIGS